MCEIFPRVYLGDRFTSQDPSFMIRNRITHIVNCTKKLPNSFKNATKISQKNRTTKSSSVLNDFEEDSEVLIGPSTVPPPPPIQQRESDKKIVEVQKIKYYRMSVDDSNDTVLFDPHDTNSVLITALQFIKNALTDSSARILVHCFEGRSRSVTVVIGFGMYGLGQTLETSYSTLVYQVLQKNHEISMNESFQMQLMNFEKKVFPGLEANSLNFIPEREREENGFFEDMDDESNDEEEDEDYDPRKKRKKRRTNKFVALTAHDIYKTIKERVEKEKERLKNAKFKQRNIMTMFHEQQKKNEEKSSLEYRQKQDIENLEKLSFKQKSIDFFFKKKKKNKVKNKDQRTGKKRKRD